MEATTIGGWWRGGQHWHSGEVASGECGRWQVSEQEYELDRKQRMAQRVELVRVMVAELQPRERLTQLDALLAELAELESLVALASVA